MDTRIRTCKFTLTNTRTYNTCIHATQIVEGVVKHYYSL